MQKMTGTQAILMPAHETKAHGVDAWADEQMALRSQWERMTGVGRSQKLADIAQKLGRLRLAARRGRLGQISEGAIAQLEQQAQELAQELRS